MDDEKYVWTRTIEESYELFDIIQGRKDIEDLRQKCIFRGISKDSYKLESPSLREDEKYLNNFIGNSEMSLIPVEKEIIDSNSIPKKMYEKYKNNYYLRVDKNYNTPQEINFDSSNLNIIQIKKEIKVLLKFINYADKSGLKININQELRELLNNPNHYKLEDYWPKEDFYEVISLAQHYGTPTRFLDWSYDYNVSIYFAVKDILNHKNPKYNESNGILWAFNYKLFDTPFHRNNPYEKFKLKFYRPEYYSNKYLNAQKGLFTIILNDLITKDTRPFNEIIIDDFKKNNENTHEDRPLKRSHGLTDSNIPEGEKIFYKFIIPPELKPEILKELYLNNYSEEFLLPSYLSVSNTIKNKVILEELINDK